MPVDYVKLGARVKGRREKARMSQAELLCDSVVKAKVIYINEVAGLIESFSDVEMRALPEFLRSYSHFSKLLENSIQHNDV